MRNNLTKLSPEAKKEYLRTQHTENARKRYEKHRLEGYLRLVGAVLSLHTIENLSLEEIALKIAENGQFRVIYKENSPKNDKNT